MFKRTFWFTTGATAGFGGAMWVRRQVLRTVRRYTPEHVQDEVATSVRRLGDDLRAAITEGRDAMASREAQLRADLSGSPGDATPALGPGRPAGRRGVIDATLAAVDGTRVDGTRIGVRAGTGGVGRPALDAPRDRALPRAADGRATRRAGRGNAHRRRGNPPLG